MWPTASGGYPTATIPDNPHRNGRRHTGTGHTCPRFLSCHARRNPPGKPPIYNKCIAEGRKSNGLGEARPCLTAGERSEPAGRGHTLSRPRRGRITSTHHTRALDFSEALFRMSMHPASAGSLRSPTVKHRGAAPQPAVTRKISTNCPRPRAPGNTGGTGGGARELSLYRKRKGKGMRPAAFHRPYGTELNH